MREAVDALRRHRPAAIVGYTQSMAQWARFILERGLRDWGDVPVICGAEAVLPADRVVLAKAFGPEVFDTYGSRETSLMASECSAHAGLHLSEEAMVVEIASGQEPLGPGASGDVLITDLHNYGMPFIRYANGDMATLAEPGRCPCGRGLRRLAHVDGRRAETLHDPTGEAIPGIVFHVLFSDSRREVVKQFQAVQKLSGEIVLKVVRGQDYSDPEFSTKVDRLREYLRGQPLAVEFHDAIPPAATGKRKTVVVERA
jgi:phenylacetate-CoA ligase